MPKHLKDGDLHSNSLNEIKSQGFNDTFLRMWNYYLSYCEGGFRSRNIDVGQFLIKKN